jgi:hypothetical protein
MAIDAYKNFAYGTVLTPPVPPTSGTSLTMTTGQGARMPTPPFNAVVGAINQAPISANSEIVRVTAIAGDVLTITRAQESSTARTIAGGDQLYAGLTKKFLDDLIGAASGGGAWTQVAFNAANFTAVGGMTWTGVTIQTNEYTVIGKTLIWTLSTSGGTLGGTASTELRVKLPGGLTTPSSTAHRISFLYNGGAVDGYTTATADYLSLFKYNSTAFALGTVAVYLSVTLRIT